MAFVIMNMFGIEKATLGQLEAITDLYRTCGKAMLAQGFDNWGDFYPPITLIEEDIRAGSLFSLLDNERLLGVIVLDAIQPQQYDAVDWQYPNERCLIVHRLAIAVDQQRKGYAPKLMLFAEEYAQKNAYTAIRLDAYSINTGLLKFYRQLGYQSTKETISLGAKWKHPFVCFEKSLLNN